MRYPHYFTRTCLAAAGLLALLFTVPRNQARGDSPPPIPNPPEPTRAELFKAAGIDAREPAALLQHLQELVWQSPEAADAWLPFVRAREHRRLVGELTRLGYGDRFAGDAWRNAHGQLEKELTKAR